MNTLDTFQVTWERADVLTMAIIFQTIPKRLNYRHSIESGAKYLGFSSSHSLKTRKKYISFAQFVYFLREVCLLFNFWMIKFTITPKKPLPSKNIQMSKTNWAKLINFSLVLREREEKKLIFRTYCIRLW